MAFSGVFFSVHGAIILLLYHGYVWACIPLVLVLAYLKHCHLIAFHEASHGNLCPSRPLNEAIGHLIATLGLMSLSLYRAVHRLHHVYLGTEKDEELWPFVDPRQPRWFRRVSAILEMTCGLLYTPYLFLRCFLREGSSVKDPAVRRRVWIELTGLVLFWGSVVAATAWFGLWQYFLMMYVIPAWIAGNLQSIRKFVEHLGVTGQPPLGVTRSIVPVGLVDRFIVFTLFHEPYHGVHHRYAHLPQTVFPAFAELLTPMQAGDLPPFSTYREAFLDMFRSLRDPRTGPQWERHAEPALPQTIRLPESDGLRGMHAAG
jgi:fatty acid desaturase